MAGHPRIVTQDAHFTWDGAPQRLPKGTYIDVPPGSALETAIGKDKLAPMFREGSTAVAPEPDKEAAAEDDSPAVTPKKNAQTSGDSKKETGS